MNLLFNFYAKTQIQFITLIGKHKKNLRRYLYFVFILSAIILGIFILFYYISTFFKIFQEQHSKIHSLLNK